MSTLWDITRSRRGSIAERFAAFDAAHPEVWDWFVIFAHELRNAGAKRGSADAILHRVRWETRVRGKDARGFKINNDFTRHYALKLATANPAFAGFFEFRNPREAA
jgi:hypothetical protein